MAQNRINSSDIQIGMAFTAPVFFDDGKNMFLAEKKPVKQYHVNALKRWSIPFLLTYGTLIGEDRGVLTVANNDALETSDADLQFDDDVVFENNDADEVEDLELEELDFVDDVDDMDEL